MKVLGVAIDGGKDSLSMAARVGDSIVKAPGRSLLPVFALFLLSPAPLTRSDTGDIKVISVRPTDQSFMCFCVRDISKISAHLAFVLQISIPHDVILN